MIENNNELLKELLTKEWNRPRTDHLDIYSSFEEKKSVFDKHYIVRSSTEFLNFIKHELPEQLKDKKVAFRGVNQAKFRMFSSAQRAFRTNTSVLPTDGEIYHSTIVQMIRNARTANRGVLSNFLKSTGMQDSDVSVLSFLQHHRAPTPFTDWTTDINAALFFATDGITKQEVDYYHQTSGADEIEDYISLYILIEDHILNQIGDFKQLSLTSKKAVEYNTLKKKRFQYIRETLRSGKPAFSLYNNLRITTQSGLFIFNNSPNLPLEEIFLEKFMMHWLINNAKGLEAPRSPIICINVHKSIVYWLQREILSKQGYTKRAIYPNPEHIARMSVPRTFKTK
ncbi:FRG domain-containing protein [Pedobacter miscanthi]|uniref:FRG domain-containing protein n=1 Tax=Pedobacter miscanthi TaxID=2259170 RepID=UPI00292CCCEB|nr:FRG domain-containing protein [Pedobacter miscanthi]